jgi:hypothetical protein
VRGRFHGPALVYMDRTFGHERLMLGSDFPYFQDDKYKRIQAVTERFVRHAAPPAQGAASCMICAGFKSGRTPKELVRR